MKHFDIETNTWIDDSAQDEAHGIFSLGGLCRTCLRKLLGDSPSPEAPSARTPSS